jgi:hypothetical protein
MMEQLGGALPLAKFAPETNFVARRIFNMRSIGNCKARTALGPRPVGNEKFHFAFDSRQHVAA